MTRFEADPNSVANVLEFVTRHIEIDWNVDFARCVLAGHVVLDLSRFNDSAEMLHLDASALDISKVVEKDSGSELEFKYDQKATKFGGKLTIRIPASIGSQPSIRIYYETTSKCSAAQWLAPEQTVGKKYPYLFTQCQDTPFVKATYSASVTVPTSLTPVMSANISEDPKLTGDLERMLFHFQQTVPIPSYLIALGCGAIKKIDIGPRSAIWSEEEMLERAAFEFAETEDFIAIGEKILTPYAWGRYDILLLPPSFPYGGMENPCLTFLTPSLLAGDRSLVDVVAHEISHSWTGNLVTTANWQHFWLNEGFTMFVERKILGRKYGEGHRQFNATIGIADLTEAIELFGKNSPSTWLVPDLSDTDPDDVFSSVPYEKGHTFLYYLEQLVGGPIEFEPYLRDHIKRFSGKAITTDDWKAFLLGYFEGRPAAEKLAKVDWDMWLKGPGMPPVIPEYDQSQVTPCRELANLWLADDLGKDYHEKQFTSFKAGQKVLFLETIIRNLNTFKLERLPMIEQAYKLSSSQNVEVLLKWHILCLRMNYKADLPNVVEFLGQHGRMKYNRPLYRELAKLPNGHKLAVETFEKYRRFYHPIAAQMIAKDLKIAC